MSDEQLEDLLELLCEFTCSYIGPTEEYHFDKVKEAVEDMLYERQKNKSE